MFGWHRLAEILKLHTNCSPCSNGSHPFWPAHCFLYPVFDGGDSGSVIPLCCNWRRHFQRKGRLLQKWPQRLSSKVKKEKYRYRSFKCRLWGCFENVYFVSHLTNSLPFLDTISLKLFLITSFFIGNVNSRDVWNRDDLFRFMCLAIIACCKVSRPAAPHSSLIKLE